MGREDTLSNAGETSGVVQRIGSSQPVLTSPSTEKKMTPSQAFAWMANVLGDYVVLQGKLTTSHNQNIQKQTAIQQQYLEEGDRMLFGNAWYIAKTAFGNKIPTPAEVNAKIGELKKSIAKIVLELILNPTDTGLRNELAADQKTLSVMQNDLLPFANDNVNLSTAQANLQNFINKNGQPPYTGVVRVVYLALQGQVSNAEGALQTAKNNLSAGLVGALIAQASISNAAGELQQAFTQSQIDYQFASRIIGETLQKIYAKLGLATLSTAPSTFEHNFTQELLNQVLNHIVQQTINDSTTAHNNLVTKYTRRPGMQQELAEEQAEGEKTRSTTRKEEENSALVKSLDKEKKEISKLQKKIDELKSGIDKERGREKTTPLTQTQNQALHDAEQELKETMNQYLHTLHTITSQKKMHASEDEFLQAAHPLAGNFTQLIGEPLSTEGLKEALTTKNIPPQQAVEQLLGTDARNAVHKLGEAIYDQQKNLPMPRITPSNTQEKTKNLTQQVEHGLREVSNVLQSEKEVHSHRDYPA
ncbi:hypothetical protein JYU14_02380 [Simkania negevensis]|uniref:Uncharacterized protein n=1 Tax=Simkania negevensis TaxID=83561 RepID=A0ABS3ARZ1_9BACT|nr:hypothetical protein [Simkania negevensis]